MNVVHKIAFEISAANKASVKGEFQSASAELAKTTKELKHLQSQAAQVQAYQKLNVAVSSTQERFVLARKRAQELYRELMAADKPSRKLQAEFQRANKASQDLGQKFAHQNVTLAAMRKELESSGVSVRHLSDRYRELQREIGDTEKKQSGLRAKVGEKPRRGGPVGRGLTAGGLLVGGAVGYGVSKAASAVADGTRRVINFDREMQLMANTAGLSADKLDKVKAEIVAMSAASETNQAPAELQRAMAGMLAAGMQNDVALATLRSVGRTATATGADVEDLAKAAFTLNDAMGIDPSKISYAMDVLAVAGKEGNFELKAMAQYLPEITAQMRGFGMKGLGSVASAAAALQIVRKGTGDEGTAANNLANLYQKMASRETAGRFARAGIDLRKELKKSQANGDNPMETVLGLLQRATGGDQMKISDFIGDIQAQNAARILMQNFGEYERIRDLAVTAGGTVDRDYQSMMSTAAEQIKAAQNSIEAVLIRTLPVLTPAIVQAAEGVAWIAQYLGKKELTPGTDVGIVGGLVGGAMIRAATAGLPGIGVNANQAEINTATRESAEDKKINSEIRKNRRFATGGFVNGPTRALIGEAGPEAVIPLSDRARGLSLWERAGQALGASSSNSSSMTFAPVINISGGGDVSGIRAAVEEALRVAWDRMRRDADRERSLAFG